MTFPSGSSPHGRLEGSYLRDILLITCNEWMRSNSVLTLIAAVQSYTFVYLSNIEVKWERGKGGKDYRN